MPGWEQLGMQAAGQGISAGLGLLLQAQQDRRQLKQQEKLQGLQIRGNKELTDYNFMKQMEMWKNTNYPAQIAMLKAAGLNPALIYEGGGQGASTNVSTGSVTGGNAPTGGGEIQAMMAMGLQRELQQAQIENLKAQTLKTTTEAKAIPTTLAKTEAETESIYQGIENLKQTIQNQEAQQTLTELQSDFQKIQNKLASDSFDDNLRTIKTTADSIEEEIQLLKTQNKVNSETADTMIKTAKAELAQIYANTKLTEANTGLASQQLINLKQQVQNMIADIVQRGQEIDIQQSLAGFETSFGKQASSIAGQVLNGVGMGLGARKLRWTEIKGFRK